MTLTSPTELVLTRVDDGVRFITFNRPDALNALRPEMLLALRDLVIAAQGDAETRVIVIEGAGRAFSAGVDLKVLQDVTPQSGKIGDMFDRPAAEATKAIRRADLPVIAKVHGACFTGALEIALHCDVIYTTEDTKFGDTHAKFGLRPTWGMSQLLPRRVGLARAKELSFTARTFSGAEALAMGLAADAAKDVAALDALIARRAGQMVANSGAAIAAYKDLYRLAGEDGPLEEAIDAELAQTYPGITDTEERLADFR